MQQIADWLDKLGMSEYAQRFADNHVDFSVLTDLTDQDLEKLGVLLGDRRKLLRAIANLEVTEKKASAAAVAAAAPAASPPLDTAERRQVTVMFSDMVGSTALSARMDPEDLREVISAYQKCVAETVRRFGGFVAKYMGDGVLVYFGYPRSHEHDAEQAVRAGLELIAAVAQLKTHAALQTRVGIATGLVVVGRDAADEQEIVGETPNLAARLQGIGEPSMVVIAESTRRLVGNLFELQDLGAKDLKGIARPAQAWAALWPSSAASRFEAMHASDLTALVGREEESKLLLRRWSKAKAGEGQVVLLSGEPGIGKSRLTAALLDHLASEPHTRLRYFCSPQHIDSAFYTIVGQLERAAGLVHNDTPQAKLDKLDALLAQTSTSLEGAALIAEMLSLPNDGRYPTLELTPQQRRQRTMEVLDLQLETLARKNPVLMIFEDAHWTDPTSLEVFGRVVDRIRPLRALLLVTCRPEFEPPWIGRSHVTARTINRLAQRDVNAMIDCVAGNKLLPPSIRQDIIERTDGIPLFVEEMTKAVLEAGSEGAAEGVAAAVPSPAFAVPASLHASLMARLDRLGPAKEVAQIGAAIGREFAHALLASVVRQPETELAGALDRLIQSGLLFRQGVPPRANYLFKHALVQDAAYGTLLREPRRALHARIAEILEDQFAEIAESQPELLARHCTEAGLIEKAAGFWGKAGQRSLARSALVEAAQQLARALDQIASLPSTPALRREQITLQIGRANALMPTKGHAALETKEAFNQARLLIEQAEALGERPEDPLLLFCVLYGSWVASWATFNGDLLRERARHFLALAEKQEATGPLMVGHRQMGVTLSYTGDVAQGRVHFDRAIALYDPAEHRPLATRFGQDVRVTALMQRSLCLWLLGYPEAALADAEQALSDARASGHAATLAYALLFTWFSNVFCGNYATATAQANEMIALAEEKGSVLWNACGSMLRGCVLAVTGGASEAVQIITSGIVALPATGQTLWMPFWLACLAKSYADLGEFIDARRYIAEARATLETNRETWYEAELNRLAGEIALMPPERDAATAQTYFERALAVARARQTKSWELRAAMSMARLWRDQGKRNEARDLLAPVYGWFTEGLDTLDLKEARTLLNALTS